MTWFKIFQHTSTLHEQVFGQSGITLTLNAIILKLGTHESLGQNVWQVLSPHVCDAQWIIQSSFHNGMLTLFGDTLCNAEEHVNDLQSELYLTLETTNHFSHTRRLIS